MATNCHISVVSPIYRGEKMVAELVNRIVQAMHTIETESACSAVSTNPADIAAANDTTAATNMSNTPPPQPIRL